MGTIEVVNVRDYGGVEAFERQSAGNVYIGRRPGGNILGNPFTHLQGRQTLAKYVVGSREESVKAYEKYSGSFSQKAGSTPPRTSGTGRLRSRETGSRRR